MRYLDSVNILQGTQSQFRYSNGNTLPLAALPNAMNAWTLQTRGAEAPWFFHPDDRHVEGLRLTHQPSPWLGDYAPLLLTPQAGPWRDNPQSWFSSFDPQATQLSPAFLKLKLRQGPLTHELVPLLRGGRHKIAFPAGRGRLLLQIPQSQSPEAVFAFDAAKNQASGRVLAPWREGQPPLSQHLFLKIKTKAKMLGFRLDFAGGAAQLKAAAASLAPAAGLCLEFTDSEPFVAEIDLATSYISLAQAKENLRQETQGLAFAESRKQQEALWEESSA